MQRGQSGLKSGGRGFGSKNSDFARQFNKEFRFFMANLRKISIFSGNFIKKVRFSRQKFLNDLFLRLSRQNCPLKDAFTVYFWANCSIYLEKSPFSNILPVHDKIIMTFYEPPRPPCDPHDPPVKNLGKGVSTPLTPRIDAYV